MAVRSKAQDCGRIVTGIAGSNPAEGMAVRPLCLLCSVSSVLCDGLIPPSEESYRACVCVSSCV